MLSNYNKNNTLNEQQKKAVRAAEGPLLIAAGPGTGKTGAIAHRIALLINERHISPDNILAITFTNKAAEELKRRVAVITGLNTDSFHIGTFHYICNHILRKEIHLLGRKRDFAIYDEGDRKGVLRGLTSAKVSSVISDIKNEVVTLDECKDVKDIYNAYEDALKKNNALDFDDLILKTIEIFKKEPEILSRYGKKFAFILVDEYQDINTPQYRLIRLLSSPQNNLCVIGDADQAIYSFRGAHIRNFLNFQKDYPDAATIKLERNYRSTQIIVNASRNVITHNRDRLETKVFADNNDSGEKIAVLTVYDEKEEAKRIAEEIEKQMGGTTFNRMDISNDGVFAQAGNRCFSDFAVLYRIHTQSRPIEEAFVRAGIPYQIVGGLKFYDRKEIKDIVAYLRLIHNLHDNNSFLRIINIPSRQIGEQSIAKIQSLSESEGLSCFTIAGAPDRISGLGQIQKEALEGFTILINKLNTMADERQVEKMLQYIVGETGMESYYNDGTENGSKRMENISALIASTVRFEGLSPKESLLSFLEHVSLTSGVDAFDPRAKAVTLMTIHAAKGLEFPAVFICGVEEGLIPYMRSDTDVEEERRLFYVAMTRAKTKLYLFHAKRRFLYGTSCENPQSSFLSHIPPELLEKKDYSTVCASQKKKKYNPQMNLFG